MTVQELKEYLSKFDDQDKVVVAVGSYYKAYPLDYLEPDRFHSIPGEVRYVAALIKTLESAGKQDKQ